MKKLLIGTTLALALTACQQQGSSLKDKTPVAMPKVDVPVVQTLPADPYAHTLESQARRPKTPTSTTTPTTTTEPYNITLNFAAGSDQRVVDAMNAAASRWQGVITQGLADVSVSIPSNACGSNPAYTGTVDDILVFTGSKFIDGPGGTLAQSGPCSVRSSNGLTVYSTLMFDSADLDAFGSQLTSIAAHELGHSLGIGSLWSYKGLTSGSGTTDPRYTGSNGNREYSALGGTLGLVPEENQGGQGTAESHWREKTLVNELMTGYLNSGSNPLSRLSIAGLHDLGYNVDYTKADAFSSSSINSLHLHSLDITKHEEVLRPIYRVD